MTIQEFIQQHGLTMTSERISARPDGLMQEDKKHPMFHYLCTITRADPRGNRTMTLCYSMGSAHVEKKPYEKLGYYKGGMTRKDWERLPLPFTRGISLAQEQWIKMVYTPKSPDLASVLDGIGSEACSIYNASHFEDWCGDYGYDTDSRKAEQTYEACKKQTREAEALLGREALNTLAFEVERL